MQCAVQCARRVTTWKLQQFYTLVLKGSRRFRYQIAAVSRPPGPDARLWKNRVVEETTKIACEGDRLV